ncbi:adenylate/guanylate cyclase domain-containing protein [cf. Phormidesmis sp. LEGE 11477]|nr:adenylate/guanylate cyclase domain-containing protein [cf. Phormidesmis sp. LEGE 11477]
MRAEQENAIAQRHGLEKNKTIGDVYMVVGGVPSPQPKFSLRPVD